MITYQLSTTYMYAEIHNDEDGWFKVSVSRGMDLNSRKWKKSDISWSSYSGSHSANEAENYANLLLKAVALSAVMDSPIYVSEITYTSLSAIDAKTNKPFQNTIHLSSNDTNQVRIYLNSLKITEYQIIRTIPWKQYVKETYKEIK